ncbi:AraC family transcriptional regulator [Aureimonas sp. ME7]|uniref:AraC family transcriptional regulator n=1 Tax=Aureimonas sp. ME7 TaxID=2744252 RepID=UPI0015F3F054|nr:AraC family transcriptional regulator [Aureimonas sp. ME7]
MQDLLDRMTRRILRHADTDHRKTALPRVGFGISREAGRAMSSHYEPMACIVLQGAKQVLIGTQVLHYDAATSFVASLDLPATGCVTQASADRPYVAAGLVLDRELLSAIAADMPPAPSGDPVPGFGVAPVTIELLEAFDGLIALLERPDDVSFLAPSREREVLYRLLQGTHGPMLRQIGREGSRLSRVRRAIDWIAVHFDRPIRTQTLAEIAGMSVPSFHRHFKAATAMSPLQYQKRLRLQTARRLVLSDGDAGRAAYAVGYESASQFSREYARLFGCPPSRDGAGMEGRQAAEVI